MFDPEVALRHVSAPLVASIARSRVSVVRSPAMCNRTGVFRRPASVRIGQISSGEKLTRPEVPRSSAYGLRMAQERSNGEPSSHHFTPLTETRSDTLAGTGGYSGGSLRSGVVRELGTTLTRNAAFASANIFNGGPAYLRSM